MTTPRPRLPGRFEERLLRELLDLVAERGDKAEPTAAGPTARRWLRQHRVLALAGLALASGGTALAATTPWNPQVGDDQRGHPTTAEAPVPAEQLEALAVLRRPQTDTDRGERVQAALKLLPAAQFAGVRLSSARELQTWTGGAAMLLAAQHTGLATPGRGGTKNGLCLIVESDTVNVIDNGTRGQRDMPSAGAKCGTVADLYAGDLVMGSELEGRLQLTGLVPDGVQRVEVQLRGASPLGAPVLNNAFRVDAKVPSGSYEDARIRWLRSDGTEFPRKTQ